MYKKQIIPTREELESLLREGATLTKISLKYNLYCKKTRDLMNQYGLHEYIYYEKYIGQKYGLLTILEVYGTRNDRKAKCVCNCGQIVECFFYDLLSGHRVTCKAKACHNSRKQKSKIYVSKYLLLGWWNRMVYQANRREFEFNLTFDYVDNLWEKQNSICSISGLAIELPQSNNTCLHTACLDRIDSNIGYIEGNVQWVHKDINWMKRNMDQSEFIALAKLVYLNHNKTFSNYDSTNKILLERYINKYKRGAKLRCFDFSVTKEGIETILNNQKCRCFYTHELLTFPETNKLARANNYNGSIDRIDSKIGYTLENIQFVSKHVNLIKWKLTHEMFLEYCKSIHDFNQ